MTKLSRHLQFIRTIIHLRPIQILYQVLVRIWKSKFTYQTAPLNVRYAYTTPWIPKWQCCEGEDLTFLNITDSFTSWNEKRHGALWAFNLNYMDWLGQDGLSYEEGAKWIDRFIDTLPTNRTGLAAYPTALRATNWIKFICQHHEQIPTDTLQRWDDSLYSQVKFLEESLEFYLMGNHILENAYALYIASCYFQDDALKKKAYRLLLQELEEQTLKDGAHYELSPMYHCILLDRLLDCINFGRTEQLVKYAKRMIGHLQAITYADSTIPLLNDTAEGIAPTADQLLSYASRLGIEAKPIPLSDCGYRKILIGTKECFVDVGGIKATYQPGHTHADVMNYELRIDGRPFVVDTGISTYNKNERRQYERSSVAHNVITVADKDSSEVWSGFRVGARARVSASAEGEGTTKQRISVKVKTVYGAVLERTFAAEDDALVITDRSKKGATSRIHLHPEVQVLSIAKDCVKTDRGVIDIDGASDVKVTDCEVSKEYNRLQQAKCIEMAFHGELTYKIR